VNDQVDATRTEVSTYVPAYQKDEWRSHAEELDMSQSEFVRTMVQAGRSKIDPGPTAEGGRNGRDSAGPGPDPGAGDEASSTTGAPTGGIEEAVVATLEPDEYVAWDELLDAVVGDVERQLEGVLSDLQRENRVQYSGRHGGYTLRRGES
jgi:hypothetical protein